MIDLYYWPSVNGRKVAIMLEEVELEYNVIPIDFTRGANKTPDFLKINPNAKIPAIVDHDGPSGKPVTVFESAAILLYLADKSGRLLPDDPVQRYAALSWLIFQAANVGPMMGQLAHFRDYAEEEMTYPLNRYRAETRRLYGVLDQRLSEAPYLAGDDFSIADISSWVWIMPARQEQKLEDWPSLADWHDRVGARPGVQKGNQVRRDLQPPGAVTLDAEQRHHLYGWQQQPEARG